MAKVTRAMAELVTAQVGRQPGARCWQLAISLRLDRDVAGRALHRARQLGLIRGGHAGWWPADPPVNW